MLIKEGQLASGRRYEIVTSAKSAVPEGKGDHFIAHVGDMPANEIPDNDKIELMGIALAAGHEISREFSPGRFRIEINGPKMASKPHFHIHIICVKEGVKVRCCVDPITID